MNTTAEQTKLVAAPKLLELLWEESSRPSLRWLQKITAARAIPSVRLGRLYFYDVDAVRAALARDNTVHVGGGH